MVVPLASWYPAMAAKWSGRSVPQSEREAWVVHHTAGGSGTSPLSYARGVADMHYDRWGVPGGYQALVGTDGVIREMCGLDHQGVHSGTHYWNRHGLGLAFQGDFRTNPPSDDMLAAGAEYMAQIILPQTTHRAVRPSFTHCPGDALIALLPLEDDMPTPKDWTAEDWAAFRDNASDVPWAGPYVIPDPVTGNLVHANTMLRGIRSDSRAARMAAQGLDDVDEAEVARIVLAGLSVSAIADALGAEVGRDVADEIDRRARERLG